MVIVTEFRTDDLPVVEQAGAWHDLMTNTLVPNVIRADHEGDFRASVRLLDFGAVQVSALSYPSLETRRPPKLIRRSDPEAYQVMLTLRGGHRLVQGGREATSGPGEVMLYDTSRPWQGWASGDPVTVEGVMVQFPRALMPLAEKRIGQLTGAPISGRDGIGALLSGYLKQLVARAHEYQATDGPRLTTVTLDLLAALCAHELDAGDRVPPETHRRVLQARIHAYIEQRLGDPDLSPVTIAAAHQISTRYLHRLFHDQGMTVADRIRQRRLERCHRDLADPRLRSHPIHAIAARWGFTDAAHFSRTFRAAYGMSPRDYRSLAHDVEGGRSSTRTVRSQSTTS